MVQSSDKSCRRLLTLPFEIAVFFRFSISCSIRTSFKDTVSLEFEWVFDESICFSSTDARLEEVWSDGFYVTGGPRLGLTVG